jgi:hypothetical protein
MKHLTNLAVLIAAALSAAAATNSGGGSLVVVATAEPKMVAVTLTMPADLVSVPLSVTSDQKGAAQTYEETRQAIEHISERAKASGQFRVTRGVVSLSHRGGKFLISSGSFDQPAPVAQLYLLIPFTKERDNIYAAGADAARFVEALHLPGKARCDMGKLELAVDNPEQYRERLLKEIALEVQKTRPVFSSSGSAKLEGLAGSVLVRQDDDRKVELFLNYSLSITMEK